MTERIVSSETNQDESATEHALRPKSLNDFVGQQRVRDQIDVLLKSAKSRNVAADHMLLSGPPGLGKTTLAGVIAYEMNSNIIITSGPMFKKATDIVSILLKLKKGDIFTKGHILL